MNKNKNFHFDSVTDKELLEKCFFYFSNLYSFLPSRRLKHSCHGILALIFVLLDYLDGLNISYYGNYEK